MKIRDKILFFSLELFNEWGECNVIINYIVVYLVILLGNLYYYFCNKFDIIYEIFFEYEKLVDFYLDIFEDWDMILVDMMFYLELVFDGLWSYWFFYWDLEYLFDSDQCLCWDYWEFINCCLVVINCIFQKLVEVGIIEFQLEDLRVVMFLNVWLVIINWMVFLKIVYVEEIYVNLILNEFKQGIYQVLMLELLYLMFVYWECVLVFWENYCLILVDLVESELVVWNVVV